MLRVSAPRRLLFLRRERDQRDPLSVIGGEGLDLDEPGHGPGQILHALRLLLVTAVRLVSDP
jgi:hypothetical protein